MAEDNNGWEEYKKLIITEIADLKVSIKELSTSDKELSKDFGEFRTDVISELKVIKAQISIRAGVWGAIFGLASAISVVLIFIATK